jgi:uncharacterized protein
MPRERLIQQFAATANEEAELIGFLFNPDSYPDDVDGVALIETHAARIFLAGRKAIKIKKRIRLPFLDFTTLSLRHMALKRELDLNTSHAPDIYGQIVQIGRNSDGALAFGGEAIIDYAIVMNRFDQDDLLAHRADRAPLQAPLAKALADMVARYHRSLPPAPGLSGASVMHDTVHQLADALTGASPPSIARVIERFSRLSRDETARLAPLLDERSQAGLVRRCHGDLHLGNIVLIDGHPRAFDALEFDERLATVDVLYDLAFLLMDLDVRLDRAAANVVLNAYVVAEPTGGEIDGLRALPLFLATRAAVRGLVALEGALQRAEGRDAHLVAVARSYVAAANAYLEPRPPMLVAIGGLSGTGKSTLAASLAPLIGPAPGALSLRTDIERKRMFEVPETQRLTSDHYAEQLSDDVYAVMYAKTARALAAGHGVIFDGVSSKPAERERISEIAGNAGAKFFGLWLEAPLDTQIARVEARRDDASDSDATVVRAQFERDVGPMTWTRIDASGTDAETFEQACAVLGIEDASRL